MYVSSVRSNQLNKTLQKQFVKLGLTAGLLAQDQQSFFTRPPLPQGFPAAAALQASASEVRSRPTPAPLNGPGTGLGLHHTPAMAHSVQLAS
jgi:hypothetical protein